MTQNRRLILRAAAGAAAASALAPMAWAQSGQPIKILVGFPPGGGSDAIARLLADKLKDELGGVTVLVDNRPGAGGQIAAQMLKASPAGGHTLFLTHDPTISNPASGGEEAWL